MQKSVFNQLIKAIDQGTKEIARLDPGQKEELEKAWDIEHAYYSSALEGSRLDRKEFEVLAEGVQ